MGKMAESFNTTVPCLEDELTQLILDDQIQARIDSHNKVHNHVRCSKDKMVGRKLGLKMTFQFQGQFGTWGTLHVSCDCKFHILNLNFICWKHVWST